MISSINDTLLWRLSIQRFGGISYKKISVRWKSKTFLKKKYLICLTLFYDEFCIQSHIQNYLINNSRFQDNSNICKLLFLSSMILFYDGFGASDQRQSYFRSKFSVRWKQANIPKKSKYDGTAVYSPTHAVTAPTYIGKAGIQPEPLKFQLTKSFEKFIHLFCNQECLHLLRK